MERRPARKPRIAPLGVARCAALLTFAGFDTLLRLSWVAALVSALVGELVVPPEPQLSADGTTLKMTAGLVGALLVMGVLTALLNGVVLVAWQRVLLLGDEAPARRWHLHLGRRELVYALVAFFLILLLAMGLGMAPAAVQAFRDGLAVPGIMLSVGPVVALVIVARVIMVLPAIALERPADLGRIWQAAEGNAGRIAAVLLLVGVPVALAEFALIELSAGIVAADLGVVVDLVLRFVLSLLFFVLAGAIAAALAVLYALLVDSGLRARFPRVLDGLIES